MYAPARITVLPFWSLCLPPDEITQGKEDEKENKGGEEPTFLLQYDFVYVSAEDGVWMFGWECSVLYICESVHYK